jgi:hypothetical protein
MTLPDRLLPALAFDNLLLTVAASGSSGVPTSCTYALTAFPATSESGEMLAFAYIPTGTN